MTNTGRGVDELRELKQIWLREDRELHEPNCWRWHHRCAIARLVATVEQLQESFSPTVAKSRKTPKRGV